MGRRLPEVPYKGGRDGMFVSDRILFDARELLAQAGNA